MSHCLTHCLPFCALPFQKPKKLPTRIWPVTAFGWKRGQFLYMRRKQLTGSLLLWPICPSCGEEMWLVDSKNRQVVWCIWTFLWQLKKMHMVIKQWTSFTFLFHILLVCCFTYIGLCFVRYCKVFVITVSFFGTTALFILIFWNIFFFWVPQ